MSRTLGRIAGGLIAAVLCATVASAQPKKKAAPKPATPPAAAKTSPALVVVNDEAITEADLTRAMQFRQVPEEQRDKSRRPILDKLIEARLISQFLASRKTTAPKQEVDEQINRLRELAKKRGDDPDRALANLGYSEEALREEFALPLAWKRHVDRVLTAERIRQFFQDHRDEFDGTQVRARRILIKVGFDDAEAGESAEKKLAALREQIVSGKLTFEQAARDVSEAPSKEQGGDVGWFAYASGRMPREFARAAFGLKEGEVSQPFRTPYGAELCQLTGRKPGDVSLEDVRDDVVRELSEDLWRQTAAELRKTARIEWKAPEQ
jgi:parvulin-like peptidyl-prolyl isomerase